MKKKLEELISKIDSEKSEFYKSAIELHEDKKLKELAGMSDEGFKIFEEKKYGGNMLYYEEKGFTAVVAYYHCGDELDKSGWYDYDTHQFKVEDDKLITKYGSKKHELLELFPKITIEKINKALEKEIKKTYVYKRVGGLKWKAKLNSSSMR